MKFVDRRGIERYLNISKKRIDWDKDSRSKFQTAVKKFLRHYWEKHVVYEELPVVGTKLSVDFFNATRHIVLEVQGAQHTDYNAFMHSKNRNNYLSQIKRDVQKIEFAERNNFIFIEIYPQDMDKLSEKFFYQKFGVYLI